MSDLFLWGTPAAPLDKIESAMNAGQDFIGDDLCDHYAFRQAKADWQIWITTGSKPLPRKVVITNRTDESAPAVGVPDRLESETELHGRGFQVHAAQGRVQDRDRSAEDKVEERQHEEIIRQSASGRVGRLVLASFAMAPYADAAAVEVAVAAAVRRWWWWWRRRVAALGSGWRRRRRSQRSGQRWRRRPGRGAGRQQQGRYAHQQCPQQLASTTSTPSANVNVNVEGRWLLRRRLGQRLSPGRDRRGGGRRASP